MHIRAQSRSEQRRMLQTAQELGELNQVFWYLSGVLNGKRIAATDKFGRLPVLPVGEDIEASMQWAHFLYELTRHSSPITGLATELTSHELLETHFRGQWYVWGETPPPLDTVCPCCGAVNGCACGRSAAPWAVAHKPGRARHIVAQGQLLCGRPADAYTLSAANARRRRAWASQEDTFCRTCFEKWFFGKEGHA